jgi:hypothetical protein
MRRSTSPERILANSLVSGATTATGSVFDARSRHPSRNRVYLALTVAFLAWILPLMISLR